MGPVCPQRLPDISNETLALERMPKGRLEYLRRLLPRLKNQSEDCLYMNIYTPVQGKARLVSSAASGLNWVANFLRVWRGLHFHTIFSVKEEKRDYYETGIVWIYGKTFHLTCHFQLLGLPSTYLSLFYARLVTNAT